MGDMSGDGANDGSGAPDVLTDSDDAFWETNEIPLLRLIAEVFANALARKAAQEQIQASLREKETLLKEIHHRVKNNLQVISSLLGLQAHRITDEQVLASLRDARERVRSMALVHEQLYLSDSLSAIDFRAYVRQLAGKLVHAHNPDVSVDIDVDRVELAVDRAIPCGLIINELLSNALEHGFPDGEAPAARTPHVDIVFHQREGTYRLTIRDNGVGLPEADLETLKADSLGLELVATLAEQLDGTLDYATNSGTTNSGTPDSGTTFNITFAA